MRVGSTCSGIGTEALAWQPLGWEHAFFSEIDPFARAVLKHRFPDIPRHGDFTKLKDDRYGSVDLLVGGTPCQSFSVAGLRGGLGDERGNLALEFLRLAQRTRARWVLWENVPGVLSSNGGRDFGSILGGLAELGYGFAWRVLDAQFVRTRGYWFAVPQRRRRVFVVGYLGDWRRAAAVLFDRESLQGNPPPRRTAGQGIAADVAPGLVSSGRGVERAGETRGQDPVVAVPGVSSTVSSKWAKGSGGPAGDEAYNLIAHTLRADGFDASEDGSGRGTPLVPISFSCKDYGNDATTGAAPTLRAMEWDGSHANGGGQLAVAFQPRIGRNGRGYSEGVAMALNGADAGATSDMRPAVAIPILEAGARTGISTTDLRAGLGVGVDGDPMFTLQAGKQHAVADTFAVRRLTPEECESLQGLPCGWTLVPYRNGLAADGPRYRAIGAGMAANVMQWIGERIDLVENLRTGERLNGLVQGLAPHAEQREVGKDRAAHRLAANDGDCRCGVDPRRFKPLG